MSEMYKQAGVDIDAGNEAVERMKQHVARTMRPEVLTGIGGFGGLFGLDIAKYKNPVLVSGTDGVGTKLKLAFARDQHDTIGIDAVAMCVNDIVVQGAEPLFFLDYLACSKVLPERIEAIVAGVAEGCTQAGCALIGGETAEMPGMYAADEYDIAGFAVGVVDRDRLIDGSKAEAGDALLGLASSGLHSNGFSLVRKLLFGTKGWTVDTLLRDMIPWQQAEQAELAARSALCDQSNLDLNFAYAEETTLGDLLLTPTRIYVRSLLKLMEKVDVHGMAHITGGGLTENVPRMLPSGLAAEIKNGTWPVSAVFKLLQACGSISESDMNRTFNMGIGMVVAVPAAQAAQAIQVLQAEGETVYRIGQLIAGDHDVVFANGAEPQ